MADFTDPYTVMATNPYYQPPAAPDKLSVLGNMLLGLGMGMNNATANGNSAWAGIAPGAMFASQMIGNERARAERQAQQAAQFGMMAEYRKTQEEAMREKMRMAADAEKNKTAMGNQIASLLGFPVQGNPVQMGPGAAIANIESGGRYDALGPNVPGQGQAHGKYQVMPANIGPWTKEVLGVEMTPAQFLASPQAQDAVFNAKFGQLTQKYGPQGAARAWFAGEGGMNNPNAADVNGMTVANYERKFTQAGGAGPMPQGDSIPQSAVAGLPPEVRASIGIMAQKDPEKALQMLVNAVQNQKKDDAWYPLGKDDVKMFLGPDADPKQGYQRNRVTGEIKGIGGALVNISQEQEKKVVQQIGEQDAKRVGEIQANEDRIRDSAAKMRMATDMLKNTYTGPMAEYNQALLKALGSIGFEGAKDKASMAEAAMASINQMLPMMRAPGSGATSDFEMRTFASALPGLLNTPGGNELIAQYYDRIAERASQIRVIAERYITEKKGLTGTGYADEIKKLGPLFSKEEIDQMKEAAKVANGGKPSGTRTPLDSFGSTPPNMTPMPGAKPPLSSFGR